MRCAGWLAVLALAILLAAGGRAQADPRVDQADRLFAEGKALLDSNLIQACDKFEQSLQLNSAALGTLLNVALCDEKLGRVASAVAKFTEARDRAKEQGLREHQRAAEEHLAALEASVPHLAVALTESLPGIKVLVDDHVIAPGSLGDVAIDPGERAIVVSAPDRIPYQTRVVIAKAERRSVTIPALARAVTVTSSQRRIGQIATVSGAAMFATSIGLALYGRHLRDQQYELKNCQGERCNTTGQSIVNRARTYGNVGTVVGSIGLAAAAVGTYLWITAPSSRTTESDLSVVPAVTSDSAGLVALGRF